MERGWYHTGPFSFGHHTDARLESGGFMFFFSFLNEKFQKVC